MIADYRSDTVTKPSAEMLKMMLEAKVGDDVFGDDPTVIELQQKVAKLFNKEAALFCPSGTMANQIAIKIQTNSPGEIICEETSHVYKYEGGGIGFNSGLATKLLKGDKGRISVKMIEDAINPNDIFYPQTQLVCIENTCNKGGGSFYDLDELKRINATCKAHQLKLHLDGARIFNAIIEANYTSQEIGEQFDTISICLSKGLGAPVGSLLIGSNNDILKANRIRKILGGGMRQAGYLAAAGIFALDNNIEKLKEDHKRAKVIAESLKNISWIKTVQDVYTNIIIFDVADNCNIELIIKKLDEENIRVVPFGPNQIRMVTHLDITDEMVDKTIQTLNKIELK